MRKTRFSFVVVASLAVALFVGFGQAQDGIVIAYNSPAQWANWGGVLKAFTEATGIRAPNDSKNSGQTLAALQAESARPQADTAYFGIVFGIEAERVGVVEPYKPTNFDEIPDTLKAPDGAWFSVHRGAIAFLVNTDELGDAPVPQCWSDLTDPAYTDMVGFLDPTQAAVGYSVAVAANLALGGTLGNFDPAIAYFSKLVKNGLILPAQTATALVQQGEIPILIDADFNGYSLANDAGAPITVVIPCEGSLEIPYVMSLVKDAPHPENARTLLDFALSDAGQQLFVESYLRPIRDIDIDPAIAEQMLPPAEYERVTATDFAAMQAAQAAFTERWRDEVTR